MVDVFTAASHHDILVLVIQVAVLLLSARALGEGMQRLGQPPVVGELLAGIVLGPSLLSGAFPFLAEWILPQTAVQGYLLELVAMIGVMFLLVITGLETDLALIVRHARTALGVSWGGIAVTFSSGFLLGWWLPEFLLVDPDRRLTFALFVATALSISAIPVIAKVLMDMGLIRRDIGQTILAAGMSDDTIGWILLGIVAGLARTGVVNVPEVLRTVGSVLLFLALAFTVGRWLVRRALNFVQDEVVSRDRLLTLVVVLTFAFGAITQALNLEPVLGAFVLGILFGQMRRLPDDVHEKLESVTLAIFAPIFFAVAGLKVNVQALLDPTLGTIALLVIFVATFGKVAGTYAGARLVGGKDHWTALSYGAGLNARGALEIIIATVGLQVGILGQEMFSIIVVMAMATSLMAPFALRFVLRRVTPEREELERLEREEVAAGTLVDAITRVLLPVRVRTEGRGSAHTIEAKLLERLGRDVELSVTLLTAVREGERDGARAYLSELSEMFAHTELAMKVVETPRAADAILDEAEKDYDLIVLGAPEAEGGTEVVFTRFVDYVVRMAPCATMVVQGGVADPSWGLRRILVPTNGSLAARRAAEVAFALAGGAAAERDAGGDSNGDPGAVAGAEAGAERGRRALEDDVRVEVMNVLVETEDPHHFDAGGSLRRRRMEIAREIVETLRRLGASLGVEAEAAVREGPDPESVIVAEAQRSASDLIVIGTDVRPGGDRLYLGPRVERILVNAPCPVVILNTSR